MSAKKDISRHAGRIRQIPIYLGKMFRMFVYMNDWKVIPMAAIIAGLVAYVTGKNMFITMEGTVVAALALACVCIWNGCFNSIQVVCRERDIVKREHRDGMHISSYIAAHMIYQAFLCLLQTIVTLAVCKYAGMAMPEAGFFTHLFRLEFGITIFLITYAADMMALAISCCVRTTTAAMTIIPFVLIFELLFSGSMFELSGMAQRLTDLSLAKWGINAMCAQADYNSLQMVSVWNQMAKLQDATLDDDTLQDMGMEDGAMQGYGIENAQIQPIRIFMDYLAQEGNAQELCYWMGSQNQKPEYAHTMGNILLCWISLLMFAMVFALASLLFLERIDKDKR